MLPEGLKRAIVARSAYPAAAPLESPTTALMGEAEGVASNSAVKVLVWFAMAVFCHGPLAVVVTHTGAGELAVTTTLAACVRLPLVPVTVSV